MGAAAAAMVQAILTTNRGMIEYYGTPSATIEKPR